MPPRAAPGADRAVSAGQAVHRTVCAPLTPRTTSSSRCPTPARPSGTWRTPPGSSRRSSCTPARARTTGPFDPTYALPVQLLLQRRRRAVRRGRSAGCSRGPTVAEVYAYRAHVDERMLDAARVRRRRLLRRLAPLDRAGPAPRAAAPGADPHRPEARASPQSAAAGVRAEPPTGAADAGAAALGRVPEGVSVDRPRRRRLRVRQRGPAAPASSSSRSSSASRLVTNGEYLAFMRRRRLRAARVLAVRRLGDAYSRSGWTAPAVLGASTGGAGGRSHARRHARPVDPAEPVCHVSYLRGRRLRPLGRCRLPTEAEWEVAADGAPIDGQLPRRRPLPPRAARGRRWQRPAQLFGDVWEWTQSPYTPYPGFRPAAGALGEYNGKFMCNQMVLRGGSCATAASHIRATYRNFFPPRPAGSSPAFRLARGPHEPRLASTMLHPDRLASCADVLRGLRSPRRSCRASTSTTRPARSCSSEITELDEYYPTRTELRIMRAARRRDGRTDRARAACSSSTAAAAAPRRASCSTDSSDPRGTCRSTSRASCCARRRQSSLTTTQVCGCSRRTRTTPRRSSCLPASPERGAWRTIPGSTIGNFVPEEARRFLARIGRGVRARAGAC